MLVEVDLKGIPVILFRLKSSFMWSLYSFPDATACILLNANYSSF